MILKITKICCAPVLLISALLSFSAHSLAAEKDNQQGMLPLEDLQVFTEVFSLIKDSYVEPISDSQLFEGAIKGMLNELDTHSNYLNKAQLKQLVDQTRGNFSGIGVELDKDEDIFMIVDVVAGSPAEKADLKPGDSILKINGKPSDTLTLEQAAQLIKGKEGSKLSLTVLSLNEENIHEIKLKRAKIVVPNLTSKIIEDHYAYIKITSFQETTALELREALIALNNQPIYGIILDLRNNPGGLLDAAVDIVDAFVRKGLIVYTQGRGENSKQEYFATLGDYSNDTKLAVLINQRSASASEIVAGALQDMKRATIVGSTSYGKGSVQTILPVTNDRAIKLTTNLYYTPLGKTINIHGITPDIEVENKFIPGSKASVDLLNDLQLAAALNVLKGFKQKREEEAEKYLEHID